MKWASNCTYPRFSNNRWEFLVRRNAAQFREAHVRRGLVSFCSSFSALFGAVSIHRPPWIYGSLGKNNKSPGVSLIFKNCGCHKGAGEMEKGEIPRGAQSQPRPPATRSRGVCSRSEPERTASTPDTHMFRRHGYECPRVPSVPC